MLSANSRIPIDDVVAYADCRFREVLRAMKLAPLAQQLWMQAALIKEVVSRFLTGLSVVINISGIVGLCFEVYRLRCSCRTTRTNTFYHFIPCAGGC